MRAFASVVLRWSSANGPELLSITQLARSALSRGCRPRHDFTTCTCATLLLAENVNVKYVQTLLGHAAASITLNTYSHILPSMADAAAIAVERVLADYARAG